MAPDLFGRGLFFALLILFATIAPRTIMNPISMLLPPSHYLTVSGGKTVYSGEIVLCEVWFPDGGQCLRFGEIECAGKLGWSVRTLDGIHLIVSVDADEFFDATIQPHQIYRLSRVYEGTR